jgi:hypothetical protein
MGIQVSSVIISSVSDSTDNFSAEWAVPFMQLTLLVRIFDVILHLSDVWQIIAQNIGYI